MRMKRKRPKIVPKVLEEELKPTGYEWDWTMVQNVFPKQAVVMNYVSKFLSNVKEFYNDINSATLTGAIDVVIVKQKDGTYSCSPFHVRFGKIGVLRSREKVVDIEINGEPVDIHMKLGETGEAFFVEETEDFIEVPSHLATSPIPFFSDIGEELAKLKAKREEKEDSVGSDEPIIVKAKTQRSLSSSIIVQNFDEQNANDIVQICVIDNSLPVHANHFCIPPVPSSSDQRTESDYCNAEFPSSTTSSIDAANRLSQLISAKNSEDYVNANARPSGSAFLSSESYGTHCRAESLDSAVRLRLDFGQPSTDSIVNGFQVESTCQNKQKSDYLNRSLSNELSNIADDDKIKSKKKRRKKSSIRKRKSREVTTDNHSSDEDQPEEIFQMDEDQTDQQPKFPSAYPSSRKLNIPVTSFASTISIPVQDELKQGCSSFPERPMGHVRSRSEGVPSISGGQASPSWRFKNMLQLNLEMHPFSDGDVTPVLSPVTSRPPSPKSDTEYEMQKQEGASQVESGENRWSWTWGELPVPPKTPTEKKNEELPSDDESARNKQLEKDEDEKASMLSGMFRFMRKTKKLRHQPESEGIYLDDLNRDDLDPEIVKLYFPSRNSLHSQSAAIQTPANVKDEDIESGNGSSVPQSPHSVEGAIGGIDSDSDERHHNFDFKGYNDLSISMCGGLAEYSSDIQQERFLHSVIAYDDFCENPNLLTNPDLVIRFNNKYYNWPTAAPMLMSLFLYQRPLSEKSINLLIKEHMPKKQKKSEAKGYSWFPWTRRSTTSAEDEDGKKPEDDRKSESEGKTELEPSLKPEEQKLEEEISPQVDGNIQTAVIIDQDHCTLVTSNNSSIIHTPTKQPNDGSETSNIKNGMMNKEYLYGSPSGSSENEELNGIHSNRQWTSEKRSYLGHEKFKKTLRLSSEQISQLNLQEGANEVVFSVTTAYQGTTRCKCHIYLWKYDDKIVISDIDGTITKSDVLGHILPIIGKDWAQSGVASLFTKIKANGYQFLYLSARAIGQAHITREYLRSVRQGNVCLPEGPLLLNPSSLISAFHREVIEKKPEEFKISCLRDIQALFPSAKNPFYAGYGNKINDVWAYGAVGIPISRIFTINRKGELKHELTQTFQSSYSGLSYMVDHVFPPLKRSLKVNGQLITDFENSEDYSAFTYWREPIPDVAVDVSSDKLIESPKTEEKK